MYWCHGNLDSLLFDVGNVVLSWALDVGRPFYYIEYLGINTGCYVRLSSFIRVFAFVTSAGNDVNVSFS